MTLSPKQRAHLRAAAHHLKAILHLGREGVTPTVLHAIQDAFNTRELLKVKVTEGAPLTAREAGERIAAEVEDVQHVQTIGRTIILYRRHPQDPQIHLPS